jgi:NAD(P)-dependent dehydrogenase (short-subunit alcohol dehydrogenase family)
MKDFRGKTAFITGGAGGIGLSMARAFGGAGMNVVIADVDESAAKDAAERLVSEQIKAIPVPCDVSDRKGVHSAALSAVAAFGKVHIVCNNAGVAVGGPIGTVKERDWDWIIDVNLKGVIYGVETFVPLIRGHGEGGHIVNTASMAGIVSPPGMEPYTATKFAVVAMSEGWAGQLAPLDIGVSVLCPGFVRTRIHESGRNRQERYGGHADVDPGLNGGPAVGAQMVLSGIDPDVVGPRVLEAVRDNELYVFTHPQFKDAAEARFAAIRSAFDRAAASEALKAVKSWPARSAAAP